MEGAILLKRNKLLSEPFTTTSTDGINSILHVNKLLLNIYASMGLDCTKPTNIQKAFDMNRKLIEDIRKWTK